MKTPTKGVFGGSVRAAIYARVSTSDQHTIPEQVHLLTDYAQRRGWQVTTVVREVASGAAVRAERDGLLEAARRRELDAILVYKLDRWGRSVADLVTTLHELGALGVAFVSHTEALDLSTPSGRALAGMLAVFAEFERDLIRERVRGGIDRARREGKQLGRPNTAAKHADEVRQLREQGTTQAAIARKLKIGESSVRRILSMAPQDAPPSAAESHTSRACRQRKSAAAAPEPIFQIKLVLPLSRAKTTVWRRVRIPARRSLSDLHQVIQIVFGWEGYHLHRFEVGGVLYGSWELSEVASDHDITIEQALGELEPQARRGRSGAPGCFYEYDMGDQWEVGVFVESLAERRDSKLRCLAGAHPGPPEDSGGPLAYRPRKRKTKARLDLDEINEQLDRLQQSWETSAQSPDPLPTA